MWKNCSDELPDLVKPEKYGCSMSRKVIFLFANNQASVGHVYQIPDERKRILIQTDSVMLITADWNIEKSRLATEKDFEMDDEGYARNLGCTHGYIPEKTRWTELPE